MFGKLNNSNMQTRKYPIEKQLKHLRGKKNEYQKDINYLKEEIKLLKQSKKQQHDPKQHM